MYTPGWVSHCRDDGAEKPSDSLWGRFRDGHLRPRFHGICGYCEEKVDQSNATVDHFRPKSKFPELVYEWSNWVFVCRKCNNCKGDKWPDDGYVNPCTCSMSERPENFFDFDIYTGEILPKPSLSPERCSKSRKTIDDIGLNDSEHLKERRARIKLVQLLLSFLDDTPHPDIEQYTRRLTYRDHSLSSVTRKVLGKYGFPVEEDRTAAHNSGGCVALVCLWFHCLASKNPPFHLPSVSHHAMKASVIRFSSYRLPRSSCRDNRNDFRPLQGEHSSARLPILSSPPTFDGFIWSASKKESSSHGGTHPHP